MQPLDKVLFFPVTPFTDSGDVNLDALAVHIQQGLSAGPGGVFVACGTGEGHALDFEEYVEIVRIAVSVAAGAVRVFAGAGGPVRLAQHQAKAAELAGADGLLLLPPYLVEAPGEGLVRYTQAVAEVSNLPVIVYHRGNALFDPNSAMQISLIPTVTGLKDGHGDLDLLARMMLSIRSALGADKPFSFFNGLPTAEMTMRAYRAIGVYQYSSAIFGVAPEISLAFYNALTAGRDDVINQLLEHFFAPFVTLRRTVPGYAVSLIKAGVRFRGLSVGQVRPPLVDPSPEHLAQLHRLLAVGLDLVGAAAPPAT